MKKELIRNRYLMLKQIGSGGFATVFQAWDYNLEKFVAVKRIQQHLTSTAIVVDTFRQEALRSAKLQHENIVQVYDFFRSVGNICYIIMEYVRGKDLSMVMKRCKEKKIAIPSDIALKISVSVSRALSYAHEKRDEIKGEFLGILHLDISPANIMMYSDGRIKLTDFGIAKAVQAGAKTETDTRNFFKGKFHYMSPEQIRGSNVDHRSDLFSIGIVLYELLTGLKPFDGPSDNEILEKILKSTPDFSKVPDNLAEILKKLLEKNPVKRFKNSKELLASLEEISSKMYGDVKQDQITGLMTSLFPELVSAEETEKELMQEIISKVNVSEEIELEKTPTPITIFADSAEKTVLAQPYFHKQKNLRLLFIFAIILVVGVLPFELLIDIPNALTPVGKLIKKNFIPVSISINSSPEGADIKLLDSKGNDVVKASGLKNLTPVKIRGIISGEYIIKLTKNGFRNVTRKIRVDKEIASGQKNNLIEFMLPFEVDIIITSFPDQADVYIDGRKTGLKTPFQIALESTLHSIGLYKEGFMPTGKVTVEDEREDGICNLNLQNDKHEMDKNLWEISVGDDKGKKIYTVKGALRKEVLIDSSPQGAKVFIGGSSASSGKTPIRTGLKLGKIPVKIEKENYAPVETIIPTENMTKDSFTFQLTPLPAQPVKIAEAPKTDVKEEQKTLPPVKEPEPQKPAKVEKPKPKPEAPKPKPKLKPKPVVTPPKEAAPKPPETEKTEAGTVSLNAMDTIANWFFYNDPGATGTLNLIDPNILEISYDMISGGRWIGVVKNNFYNMSGYQGIKFMYKAEGAVNSIEFKLEDSDGSNFGTVLKEKTNVSEWTTIKIPFSELTYWWGGDQTLAWGTVKIHFAISKKDTDEGGLGKVYIKRMVVY
ncbi:MAG: protein kinase [Elusimicrobiota bacterium]